jgi:hypothetical protein
MAQGSDVLKMLRPQGGWVITESDFDSIRWDEGVEPLTREEFQAGFAQYDFWKAQQDAETKAAKQAIFNRLGITEDEAKLLLS